MAMGLPLCNGSDVQEAADVMGEGVDADPRCACGHQTRRLWRVGRKFRGRMDDGMEGTANCANPRQNSLCCEI